LVAVGLTSDVAGAVSELLDLFLGEDAKDNDKVLTLFETLVGLFKCFWVDQAAVDLSPPRSWWDAFLMCL
jgi:hypothetical protein